jgi:hypothetical protein
MGQRNKGELYLKGRILLLFIIHSYEIINAEEAYLRFRIYSSISIAANLNPIST